MFLKRRTPRLFFLPLVEQSLTPKSSKGLYHQRDLARVLRERQRWNCEFLSAALASAILQESRLLHGFMYSSSPHIGSRFGANRDAAKLLKEQLYQAEAVKALREQLENWENATPEDVTDCVITILCLVTNQRQDLKSTEPDETPFHPPLAGAAWLSIYGVANFSEVHCTALERLVKANGGLARLAVFGLPWVIS
jgi:hypothetical protein